MKALLVILLVSTVGVWAQALAQQVEAAAVVSQIVPVKYAKASDIAALLNSLGKQDAGASAAGDRNEAWSQFVARAGISNEPAFIGEVRINSDERINSMLVQAS